MTVEVRVKSRFAIDVLHSSIIEGRSIVIDNDLTDH